MSPGNTSLFEQRWKDQFWGPVTATLDWCEVSKAQQSHTLISRHIQLNLGIGRQITSSQDMWQRLRIHSLIFSQSASHTMEARSSTLLHYHRDISRVGWCVQGSPCILTQVAHWALQGFALVGLGSFIFHATLLYSAQLADELPMIYVASYCCAVLFDTQPGFGIYNVRSIGIIAFLVSFNITFTLG